MNRSKLLAAAILLILLSVYANAQDLDARSPLSLELNLDSRATYQTIADRAGLNVVFVRGYTPKAAEVFRVENKTPAEALDQLAKQTATFWTSWNKKTILVAEDTEQNRRDFDRQFVQILPVANKPVAEVVNDLRARGFKRVAATGNAIMVRDTPAQIRVAAGAANADLAASAFNPDGVFVAETSMNARTPESRRAQLKIKATDPISLNVDESSRAIYVRLAKNAGLNILFRREFRVANAKLTLSDVGFFDALDLLALTTGTFWQPLNENTILVLEDTQQNRRDFDLQTVETIYVPAATTTNRLNEIISSLRTVLESRGIYQSASASAIVIRDTPARIALTESLVADMSGAPLRRQLATDIRTSATETGAYFHTAGSDRSRLQIKIKDPVAFASTADSREAFEKLAAVAGLQVLFGRNFPTRPVDFNIQNVDVIEALDFLALHSGNFWRPLDSRTIFVLEDTQQQRRDFDQHVWKTIYLPRETSTNGMNEIMNVLRTALLVRGIFQAEPPRAIVIHDIPQRVALVETLVDHLNTVPTPTKSVQIPAPRYAESRTLGIAPAARPELSVSVSTPVSINLNQDSQGTYEALTDMAGIKVIFSPDFRRGSPQPFRLEGVDVLDAIDYFSLVTENEWKIVDRQSILVFPDTTQNRQNLETQITKTFYIGYKPAPNTVNGILNVLRTAMSMRNVQSGDGFVTVQDTPQRMMIAEKVIESLDRKPMAPENPEMGSLKVVLSGYRDNVEVRTQSHSLDVEVGAEAATFRSGSTVPVTNNGQTFTQQVGIQIDSQVRSAVEGRYRVSITITTREVYQNLAWPTPPGVPAFRNFVFAGTLALENGGTAQLSGTDSAGNETWRADVTLSLKK